MRWVMFSHGKYIILLDADNPTNAQTIMSIVKHLRRGYDIIVGSRAHRLSVLNSPSSLPRGAQRRVFNRFVKLLLM